MASDEISVTPSELVSIRYTVTVRLLMRAITVKSATSLLPFDQCKG